jgi:long-chain acyl-CoA synthetase
MILYTSGTTGDMKGVVLTHRNIVSNAFATMEPIDAKADDINLSLLPYSHAFEHTCALWMILFSGGTVAIGRGPSSLIQDLQEIRPTLFAAVPRVLEKIHALIL